MAFNIWSSKCGRCRAPCVGGFTKCARLPSGVDIYQYGMTGCPQVGERVDYTYVFHHNSDTEVNKQIVIDELNKYRSGCITCNCIIKRIRVLLTELSQIDLSEVSAVCEHCQKLAEGITCKRCQYIINKFKYSHLQIAQRHQRLCIWISNMKELQDLLSSQACFLEAVKKAYDLEELRRISNAMHCPVAPRSTPNICDWTGVSLDKLYENKEILLRILDRMRDEGLVMPSFGMDMLGDANLGDDKALASLQALRPPNNTPAPTIKTAPSSDGAKTYKKTTAWKFPTQKRKIGQGQTEGATQYSRTKDRTLGKVQQKSKYDGKSGRDLQNLTSRDGRPISCLPRKLPLYYIYEMTPVQSENNWMALNKSKGVIYYDSGEILAIFKENDAVTWYYKNGMVALVYNSPKAPEGDNEGSLMYVVYSFEVDTRKKQSILAKFDYCGSGVVYDHQGNERLIYNQNSGKLLDRNGAPTTWLWHNLNEPPTYRKIFVDTYERNPDPVLTKNIEENEKIENKSSSKIAMKNEPSSRKRLVDNSDRTKPVLNEITGDSEVIITMAQQKAKANMSKVEMENHAKKNKTRFETYTIHMKRIMINELFSLKIIRQTQIYLMFHDGFTRFRLDLGLEIHHKVTRKEYVFVSNEDYNICDHMSESSWDSILNQIEQGTVSEQKSLKESV